MDLSVLLIEDDAEDMQSILDGLPSELEGHRLTYDPCADFESAKAIISRRRYDLIISDTYRGAHDDRDSQVINIVNTLKSTRFTPVIAYSSGECPAALQVGPFLYWADKAAGNKEIVAGILTMLKTNIPQISRRLHDDLDSKAALYLWGFLESKWDDLQESIGSSNRTLERIIRRRASVFLADIDTDGDGDSRRPDFDGPEYYVYPSIVLKSFRLGEIIHHNSQYNDLRVVLTPHCHLAHQNNNTDPKASYVLTTKVMSAEDVIAIVKGDKKHWKDDESGMIEQLRRRTQSPADQMGEPRGRYWYLPKFLDIPHSYCDFLQIESIEYSKILTDYTRIATLASPFAEAMQACFASMYGSVGLPPLRLDSVRSMIPSNDSIQDKIAKSQ